jgi:hypothetical protein
MRQTLVVVSVCLLARLLCAQTTEQTVVKTHYEKLLPLKLHLTFHQPYYAPGDTAFFSYFLLDARSLMPLAARHVIHLQLIDDSGRVRYQQQFLSTAGWDSNQFVLPQNIKGGTYTLVGYSEWMKNMGAHTFFRSPFYITEGAIKTTAQDLEKVTTKVVDLPVSIAIQGRQIHLSVKANAEAYKKITVLCLQHYQLAYQVFVTLGLNGHARFELPSENLQSGIFEVIALAGERTVGLGRGFVPFQHLEIELDNSIGTLKTRSHVRQTLRVRSQDGLPELARMSVKVIRSDLFEPVARMTSLCEYLFFNSEGVATSKVSKPGIPTSYTNQVVQDLFKTAFQLPFVWPPNATLNHVWRQDLWMEGQFLRSDKKKNPEGTRLTLYQPQLDVISEVPLDPNGDFQAAFFVDFNGAEYFFPYLQENGKHVAGAISFAADVPVVSGRHNVLASLPERYFDYRNKANQIRQAFQEYSFQAQPEIQAWKPPVKPDFEIDLDRFMIFPTMSETLREAIPYVQHRTVKGQDEVRMFLSEDQKNGEDAPIFIIDGIFTTDSKYFLSLIPEQIKKISGFYTRAKRAHFGQLGRNGLLIVETKKITHGSRLSGGFLFDGFSKKYSPQSGLDILPTRTPRLGPVLLWLPNAATNEAGEFSFTFTTGDESGNYEVIIEGLTTSGEPLFASFPFRVRYGQKE